MIVRLLPIPASPSSEPSLDLLIHFRLAYRPIGVRFIWFAPPDLVQIDFTIHGCIRMISHAKKSSELSMHISDTKRATRIGFAKSTKVVPFKTLTSFCASRKILLDDGRG